jgi:catechol 2,3-dioxygenase-like lactoylglutathione lyase family enzyme
MRLRHVLVQTRDMQQSLGFWRDGLGLASVAESSAWSELALEGGATLGLKLSEGEAVHSAGYHPQLVFEVASFDALLYRLLAAGGRLDGPVKHPATGKVASLRSVDGAMLGLVERSLPD